MPSEAAVYHTSALSNGTQFTNGADLFGTTWHIEVLSGFAAWMSRTPPNQVQPIWRGPGTLVGVEVSAVALTPTGEVQLNANPSGGNHFWEVFGSPYSEVIEAQKVTFTKAVGGAVAGNYIRAFTLFQKPANAQTVRFDLTYTTQEVPEQATGGICAVGLAGVLFMVWGRRRGLWTRCAAAVVGTRGR